nr:segregation/condensation protein A [uncultured Ligilactobacillus sp.]
MKRNETNQVEDGLTFKFEKFEGPLDLLLHLIRQNEMDIYDIPMAQLTSQYMNYLHEMQTLQLDVAGEYLVMASMLLNIKSKMLLPTEQVENEEIVEEFEDPREELVQQLLLHETFQNASQQLQTLETQRQQHYSREQAEIPDDAKIGRLSDEQMSVELLQNAFQRMLIHKKIVKPISRKVNVEKYSIKDEISRIKNRLMRVNHPIEFNSLFGEQVEAEELVTTFLALLELIKRGETLVTQPIELGPITLERGVH